MQNAQNLNIIEHFIHRFLREISIYFVRGGDSTNFSKLLQTNLRLSEDEIALMQQCAHDEDAFYYHLKRYIQLRYMLMDESRWTDDIPELSKRSIEASQELLQADGSQESLQDTSLNCAGATSHETKQILLLINLRKKLDISLTPEQIGLSKDVRVLSEILRLQLV